VILRGKRVPHRLRERDVKWIGPTRFKANFESAHDEWECGFRAGYLESAGELPPESVLEHLRKAAFIKHCLLNGFTHEELETLSEPQK
jgi:hypothetical protein